MAGNKAQKAVDDQTKKRKRESNDASLRTKRARPEDKVNGETKKGKKKKGSKEVVVNGTENSLVSETKSLDLSEQFENSDSWQISKPMGGRMLDIDPILAGDEQHLILTYNTSIQVYSASDSLLVRRIPITNDSKAATIVATQLSRTQPDYLWVATDDGHIYYVNWTATSSSHPNFPTQSGTAHDLALCPIGNDLEAVLVAESDKSGRLDVNAYAQGGDSSKPKNVITIKKTGNGLKLLKTSDDGRFVIGALNDRLFFGVAPEESFGIIEDVDYEFYSFDAPDIITCLDLRVDTRRLSNGTSSKKGRTVAPVVDIIVGGARGAIYLYHDALTRSQSLGKAKSEKEVLQAQKYHWHRKAVHSAKWSRDGNYMISGGSENVLVIWQMDTSKKDFLPHLSGSIENIVVSQNGSSYIIHLDDNSTMIISTAEMKPTAYVSGIQSATMSMAQSKDLLVQRTWSVPGSVRKPIPAAIRPTDPSKLHVCVGNGRQSTMTGDFSAPYLQSLDLESFTSIAKQPLARTQPTDVNITNKGIPINEPLITYLSFSHDGDWLASIDEWQPAGRDADNVLHDHKEDVIEERYETYLKFWEVGQDDTLALASRVNAPHASELSGRVLDLATNPGSTCFATIGVDGKVRLWKPKPRQQDGVAVKGAKGKEAWSWSCSQVINVGDSLGIAQHTAILYDSTLNASPQGAIAFSEDGSTIFAAYGALDGGVVHVIDATSGDVVKTLDGLWDGKLRSIKALSPFIVILSKDIRVYDVVSDELRYGIKLPLQDDMDALVQMAVDTTSGHFAVSLPAAQGSAIGVFDPEEAEPLLVRALPHKVTSLLSSPDTAGFIAVDDAAQVWTIAEASDPLSLAALQPLEDMRLNGLVDEISEQPATILEEDTEMAGDEDVEESEPEDVDMDDDNDDNDDGVHANMIAQHQLADIFDAAPAFAAPSIEDMFYKVTSLLAAKPLIYAPEV